MCSFLRFFLFNNFYNHLYFEKVFAIIIYFLLKTKANLELHQLVVIYVSSNKDLFQCSALQQNLKNRENSTLLIFKTSFVLISIKLNMLLLNSFMNAIFKSLKKMFSISAASATFIDGALYIVKINMLKSKPYPFFLKFFYYLQI